MFDWQAFRRESGDDNADENNNRLLSGVVSIFYYTFREIYRITGFKSFLKSHFFSMPIDLNSPIVWDILYRVKREVVFVRESRRRYDEILRVLSPHIKDGDTVFDFGCGSGEGLTFLSERLPGLHFKGGDYSQYAVALARGKGLDVIVCNENLSEEGFDWIISVQTLEHIKDPLVVVDMFLRLAKKGIVINVPKPQFNMELFHISCLIPEGLTEKNFEVIDFGSRDNNFLFVRR